MKTLKEYLFESLEDKIDKLEDKAEEAEDKAEEAKDKAEEANASITDEKSFKSYAENKFKKVFGDKVDKDRMNSIIDGLLDSYKEEAEAGDWGKLIGALNKSFGH